MADTPTITTLIARDVVTSEQVDAAVLAYMADPAPGPRAIAEGISVDVVAAIQAYPPARDSAAREDFREETRRLLVRTAILLARVEGNEG